MSRRKQAKPQYLKSDEEARQAEIASDDVLLKGVNEEDSGSESCSGSEETHICEKCCAKFFKWPDLCEHQGKCTKDPPVLIVKEDERMPTAQSPAESSSASSGHSDSAEMENAQDCELVERGEESSGVSEGNIGDQTYEPMDGGQTLEKTTCPSPRPADSSETATPPPSASAVTSYGMPSTNVTLEILHSTRVAVAQFSQGIHADGPGGRVNPAAIPMILEQLMALQQQQVHQLQLIEQIRSQVAVMNRQPTQAALNPASKGHPSAPSTFRLQGLLTPPVLPLSGMMPSAVNGQASVSLASALERPPSLSSQPSCGQPSPCTIAGVSASVNPNLPPSSCSVATSLLPPYSGALSSVSCIHPLSSPSPRSLGQSSLLGSSANLPLLPQSPPSGVIFPNPLASIAATAIALDPLSALLKHRKGKLPNVSIFDTKPSSEDPFFKHKCRFCAKVFGSDSALQIHLRSHTGERPFKCNICGNRFSTKGNLKVHFQRHKDKYPHVQMNPYPVPEYLDNIPTSSGIPYGMSFPPEKAGATWLDGKPILATVPTSVGLQLPPNLSGMENLSDSLSTSSGRSPPRPSPARSECASLSPNHVGAEPMYANVASLQSNHEGEAAAILTTEEIHLPQNCASRAGESLTLVSNNVPLAVTMTNAAITAQTSESSDVPSSATKNSPLPLISNHLTTFPFGGLLDSMQTSETSKLQQLVENIDRKMTDPNQCVTCCRVLSCHSALKMHHRIHTGERPFKCKACGRAFTTKGNLKTHFGVHREKPPLRVQHSCPICQKKFTNAVVLQQHIRMHMGGQIPNVPQSNGFPDMDTDLAFDEKSFDSMSNFDDDGLDDNFMEEDAENGLGDIHPLGFFTGTSPNSLPPGVSSLAALELQMTASDSNVNLNHSYGLKSVRNGFVDSDCLTNDSSAVGDLENHSVGSPATSEWSSSMHVSLSPAHSHTDGHHHNSFSMNLSRGAQGTTASVKCEQSDSPLPTLENGIALNQTGFEPGRPFVKEENPYSMLCLSREHGTSQSTPNLVTSTTQSMVKMEMNGYSRPFSMKEGLHLPFGLQPPTGPSAVMSPGITSVLGPPPSRRTPKQHNCHACRKNFSSASALQIHERTHTGEKPFGCSICGRAFTTKGNLKVHMGTHMWNNTPARRGRRLSVENPMALLGGEALKFSEMFQKDLAARAMNVDAGFWSRYAAAITNGLAMKNNEISVIQNGGVPQLPTMTMAMDRASTGNSPPMTNLGKTGMDLGVGRHFSTLIDDSKEIVIN